MKPRLITLIPAFALLMSSTSLALALSSTPSEQDSGQPAETTETSPESGSGVNAEEGAETKKENETEEGAEAEDGTGTEEGAENESDVEDYAGDEEGAETGEASQDDGALSAEEGAEVDESDAGAAEQAGDKADEGAEDTQDATDDAADTEATQEEPEVTMEEEASEGETTEGDAVEEPTVDISSLRPLKGEYEGVTLSNGMAAEEVAGSPIANSEGDELGRVEDLLADDSGEAVAVLVESGGILGIGAKQIAIPLAELSAGENGELVSSLTEEDIETMPEYEAPEDMN